MKKRIFDYLLILFGSFILAFAINFFLVPLKISTGGISGLGIVFYHLFKIPLSLTTLILNILLFFFGFRTLPKEAIPKSVAGILFLSLFLELTKGFSFGEGDMIIASVFGGILCGVGVGLVVFCDGSTGGSDFAALILHKVFPHVGIASYILVIDAAVIVLSGIVFQNWSVMFYSVISLYISSKVTDFLLVRGDFAKSVTVVSSQANEIAEDIMNKMERGVTGFFSRGCYTKTDGMTIVCVVRNREVPTLLSIIKEKDPLAFTIISDVRSVHGEGFGEYGQ